MKSKIMVNLEMAAGIVCAGTLLGCSHMQRKKEKSEMELNVTRSLLQEEARALNTGVVDTLSVAPINRPTQLALDLARHAQQIEGIPAVRIDTQALLQSEPGALAELADRYRFEERTVRQKELIQNTLRQTEQKLIELGQASEQQRNRSLVSRLWRWTIGTLGIGGLIAVCILFPAVIPLAGSLIGWLVARVPGLASWFGVVGKKAFDSVVNGVGKARVEFKKEADKKSLEMLNNELSRATDEDDRKLIEARRAVLKV